VVGAPQRRRNSRWKEAKETKRIRRRRGNRREKKSDLGRGKQAGIDESSREKECLYKRKTFYARIKSKREEREDKQKKGGEEEGKEVRKDWLIFDKLSKGKPSRKYKAPVARFTVLDDTELCVTKNKAKHTVWGISQVTDKAV